MRRLRTDFLVIGSGFGGAAVARRLAEAGADVLMIEKGRDIVPTRDFRQTQDPEYLRRYLKVLSSDSVSLTYAEGLGGGSGFFEMVVPRAPREAFEQPDGTGRRLWPPGLGRAPLDPFYAIAERELGVRQLPIDRIGKTGVVFSHLMRRLGYSCDRAPYALFRCPGAGYCVSGCVFGAKHSLHVNYLPAARRAGLSIATDLEAIRIRPARGRGDGGYEIACRAMRGGGEDAHIAARVVALGAGTVGTARLLLDSARELGDLGEHVGRNVALNGSIKIAGLLPDGFPDADMVTGPSHPGMISYEFWAARRITVSAAKALPLLLLSAARIADARETRRPRFWGEAHVDLMRKYRHRMLILYSLGLTPPEVWLERVSRGRVVPHSRADATLRRHVHDTRELMFSLIERNGGTRIDAVPVDHEGQDRAEYHSDSAHMMGSCRMAGRAEHGVVDAHGEAFGHRGLFVVDGACIPASLGVNPSLTILANAERIAAGIVARAG